MNMAVKFGLAISAIMSTLWLLFGYFELPHKDPDLFVLYDGFIFILQGILSGLVLHYVCKIGWLGAGTGK
jgi:hypothetical protein